MSKTDDIIEFTQLEGKFSTYLSNEDNKQILFTGEFGSGKTTFLKTFFEKNSDKYETIRIFPVNYSLHHNSDVYEILKYDIILELINKGAFKSDDISDLVKYVAISTQAFDKAFIGLLSIFSKTGKKIKDAVDLIKKTYQESDAELRALSDPLNGITAFGKVIDAVKGYEYDDYVTSVIKDKLKALCSGSLELKPKENVLIVDDLDRIDPDHLFRIISIFSAHIDLHTEENKFGFDKIIFVGDIHNIKGMFEHKYGIKNSFNAFISKLSSKNPFHFSPEEELFLNTPKLLIKYRLTSKDGVEYNPFDELNNHNSIFFNYIICSLINNGKISLREIQKNKTELIHIKTNTRIPKTDIVYLYSEIYILYMILLNLLKTKSEVISAIDSLKSEPLGLRRVLENKSLDIVDLISNLSIFPVDFLLYEDLKNLENENTSKDYDFSDIKMKIDFFRGRLSRKINGFLSEDSANEQNLIVLTSEALKKLVSHI